MRFHSGKLVYSPSDLVNFLDSPFSSWMDRYNLENEGKLKPDELSEDAQLIISIGEEHERAVLARLRSTNALTEIPRDGSSGFSTMAAIASRVPVIYQAKLEGGDFAGYSDFLLLDEKTGRYQIWDTKLARSPKPYYAVQLCCYSEMLAEMTGGPISDRFGIILGADEDGISEHIEFKVEDFLHYFQYLKNSFLNLQGSFDGDFDNRPEPNPRADHGRWRSHAERYLNERDHLIRVAGITTGHVKKLSEAGITTLTELAVSAGRSVPKIPRVIMDKLVHQSRLQYETRELRRLDKQATARFEILPTSDENGQLVGLGAIPREHPADVFFDMEGYPLMPGGLEYLFGNTTIDAESKEYEFTDFWAHDRAEEKKAFEDFIDWVYDRWLRNPGIHIYHYAVYERAAIQHLADRHATRQEEVDNLLRYDVLVDLYKIVRRGLRIGEESYSLKKVERIYWPNSRTGELTLAIGSVVQYARWIASGEPRNWRESKNLKEIRDYNKDDCDSTAELAKWLRGVAAENGIPPADDQRADKSASLPEEQELTPEAIERQAMMEALREKGDVISAVLSDLVDFHRREAKPIWWKMYNRADSEPDELRDDNGCISGVAAVGEPVPEKKSLLQVYTFDATQECKKPQSNKVMFTHNIQPKLELFEIDLSAGTLTIKATQKTLDTHFGGLFPETGSLIPDEYVNPSPIPTALGAVAKQYLNGEPHPALLALLGRKPPAEEIRTLSSTTDDAIRIARGLSGGCFVIQGPPGTGKTYTAANVIAALLKDGRKVGISSNSHKAINNLLRECGKVLRAGGQSINGVRVGGNPEDEALNENPELHFVKTGGDAFPAYSGGVIAGTAWLFSRDDWASQIDYLFVDEAGQVALANVVAMLRSTRNLILLGDQMQLEQPVQGAHPGDSRLSALQYVLKDEGNSSLDSVVFHAVVPPDLGLFLGESRRMHPWVCKFISETIYDGRLTSFAPCANQKIAVTSNAELIRAEAGIVFSGVEHDGNVQNSEEEVERIKAIYYELVGRAYTNANGETRPLTLADFLFISPYNAQVRCLQHALPAEARVGSVDKFQGQEAPVCILSMCSSYGEYGSRGLGFILDQNRINVAISRAQCLAVVVGDPRIAGTAAGSLEEMRLLNLYCKLVMLDTHDDAGK